METTVRNPAVRLITIFMVCGGLLLSPGAVQGRKDHSKPWPVPVNAVALIERDEQGKKIKFPSFVFYDESMKEIYVITSNGRITIYGSEYGTSFFPKISLGKGRGVDRPTGLHVARDGRLFICQARTSDAPSRLTVLNAALFPLREVVISDIKGAESFIPNRVALGRQGRVYLAGKGFRGVIVLNHQGEFLHWLKPEDKMLRDAVRDSEETAGGSEVSIPEDNRKGEREPELEARGSERRNLAAAESAGLPDVLRPRPKTDSGEKKEIRVGPVQITDVEVDENGYIFLLSEETGKVYIYNAREEFLFSFGQKGGSTGKLSRPRGLAVDKEREVIFVLDYMRHSVLVYNFAGRFLFEIGGQGRSPRWFNYPADLDLTDEGYLVVADLFNQRIQVLEVIFEGGPGLFGSAGK